MKEFLSTVLAYRFEIAAMVLFGIDSSVFLFLAAQGYIQGRIAPMIVNGDLSATTYINPIPSGLVLTGIVVSVSISAFFLALVQRLYKKYGTIDFDEIMTLAKKEAE
jgi:multicomponent Na+:H+ antiporter subunit C